jgi:large subunit ribosomal protein L4
MVVEETDLSEPKTRELVEILRALKLDKTRTLYVVAEMDEKLKRASRNLREFFFPKQVRDLNAYHVLRRKKILFEKEALPLVERRILGSDNL